jgi:hypothetical protein
MALIAKLATVLVAVAVSSAPLQIGRSEQGRSAIMPRTRLSLTADAQRWRLRAADDLSSAGREEIA